MTDINKLEELAKAATSGDWKVYKDECRSCGGEWDIYDIPGGLSRPQKHLHRHDPKG